jgi:hypothetical protein
MAQNRSELSTLTREEIEKKSTWEMRWRGDARGLEIFKDGFEVRDPCSNNSKVFDAFDPFESDSHKVIALSTNRDVCPIFPLNDKGGGDQSLTWIYYILVDTNNNNFHHFHRSSLSSITPKHASIMQYLEYAKEDFSSESIPPEHILMAIPIERYSPEPNKKHTIMGGYFYTAYKIKGEPIINEKALLFIKNKSSIIESILRATEKEIKGMIGKIIPIPRPEIFTKEKKFQLASKNAFYIKSRFEKSDLKSVSAENRLQLNNRNESFFTKRFRNSDGIIFSSKEKLEKHNKRFFKDIAKGVYDSHIRSELPELKTALKQSADKLSEDIFMQDSVDYLTDFLSEDKYTSDMEIDLKSNPVNLAEKASIKKVVLIKSALFKFEKKDLEGNVLMTTAVRVVDKEKKVIEDFTQDKFNTFLKEKERVVFSVPSKRNKDYVEEYIISPHESNEMVVSQGIIFYKSSGTSGTEVSARASTWMPCLGLDNKSSGGLGKRDPVFKIAKLDELYDPKFLETDERIKNYEMYLGTDLMRRFHNFDIMLLSAEIGGGFWDTEQGKNLITHLKSENYVIQAGIVPISDKAEHTFKLPFEEKKEDDKFIQEKTELFNTFFQEQGGCVHDGIWNKEAKANSRNLHKEINDLARHGTLKNRKEIDEKRNPISPSGISSSSLGRWSRIKTWWSILPWWKKALGVIGFAAIVAIACTGVGLGIEFAAGGTITGTLVFASAGATISGGILGGASATAAGASISVGGGILASILVCLGMNYATKDMKTTKPLASKNLSPQVTNKKNLIISPSKEKKNNPEKALTSSYVDILQVSGMPVTAPKTINCSTGTDVPKELSAESKYDGGEKNVESEPVIIHRHPKKILGI